MLAGAVAVVTLGISVSVVTSGKGKKSTAKKATKKNKQKKVFSFEEIFKLLEK